MKEYKFNENYNILILKRYNGIYEYYIEKVNYGNLAYMFGLGEAVAPICLKKLILNIIKSYEFKKFWKD
jgi:hypothetical protein